MTKTMKITAFNINWTADHEQYWQGHGLAFSSHTHSATGCGETIREAFEDALEDLAQTLNLGEYHVIHEATGESKMLSVEQEMLIDLTAKVKEPAMLDWDIVKEYCPIEGRHLVEKITESEDDELDEDPDCAVCAGEWHYYVTIDVTVETEL